MRIRLSTARIFRISAMPSITGILMSVMSRSGRYASQAFHASSPSEHSATTCISSFSQSTMLLMPMRTNGSSSAKITLYIPSPHIDIDVYPYNKDGLLSISVQN